MDGDPLSALTHGLGNSEVIELEIFSLTESLET